jgi:catechol 2,3-dioxygenase-like lactoylglutathione lyase family enzyme
MGIHPVALSGAHLETRSLADTIPVLTDLLAFESVEDGPDSVTLKHPNTPWIMTVHDGGANATDKFSGNHYGVRVLRKEELTAAHAYLSTHADEYGLSGIRGPSYSHGSYSVYFAEPGTNTLEIECYEDVNRKASGAERLGGVRGPHWEKPLPAERFPGRGYVPQALTHGTLALLDAPASHRFYAEVLDLEVHNAYGEGRVVYVKHPSTKHFIVCARREERLVNSPNFRYTLTVESPDALEAAHRWVADHREEYAISELHEIETAGDTSSFLIRDPDLNWWEIAAHD